MNQPLFEEMERKLIRYNTVTAHNKMQKRKTVQKMEGSILNANFVVRKI
jgi:hypothetical protein